MPTSSPSVVSSQTPSASRFMRYSSVGLKRVHFGFHATASARSKKHSHTSVARGANSRYVVRPRSLSSVTPIGLSLRSLLKIPSGVVCTPSGRSPMPSRRRT